MSVYGYNYRLQWIYGGMCLLALMRAYAHTARILQKLTERIDVSLPINKYFEGIDYYTKYVDDNKTLCMAAKVLQKTDHTFLASGLYLNACKELKENPTNKKMWIGL